MLVDVLDAIANATATGGGIKIFKSDGNWVFEVKLVATSPSGMEYRQEYSLANNLTYRPGSVVRVSPDNDVAASSDNLTGTIAGVYICVLTPTNNTTQIPSHPLSDGGETIYWNWISTWPSTTQACADDGTSVDAFTDQQLKPVAE